MKKTFYFLTIAIGLFSSCKKNKETVTPEVEKTTSGNSDYVGKLTAAGFASKDIVEEGDHFVIQGDMIVSKKDLETYPSPTSNGQHRIEQEQYRWKVSDTYIGNITVFIPTDLQDVWKTAVRNAIANWNTLTNTKVHFVETTTAAGASVTVKSTYANDGKVATGYLPTSDLKPGNTLTVNYYYSSLTAAQMTLAATHELGHNIGLLHSDEVYTTTTSTPGSYVPGTPIVGWDPRSVMHRYNQPWIGFTNGDKKAIEYLYLKPGFSGTPYVANNDILTVYRYNLYGHHYYTTNYNEYGGNGYEGNVGRIYAYPAPYTKAIHHLYQPSTGDHLYTMNSAEYVQGWQDQGVLGYTYDSPNPNFGPVYRYFGNGDHFLTNNYNELGGGAYGWNLEGVAFYTLQQ